MILRLILRDQLNPKHSWFDSPREDVVYALFESEEELRYAPHHRQKMLAFLHGMQRLAYNLEVDGHRVAQDYDANRAFRQAWLQES